MSAPQLVNATRAALAQLLGIGARSAGEQVTRRWEGLAAQARSLGLPELGARMEELAGLLRQRGALAFEPSQPLVDAVLGLHDRIEALATALALWAVEEQA